MPGMLGTYCHQEDETIVQFYQQFSKTVDCTEQMYETIMPSVMVDIDTSDAKIDKKQENTREKMIVVRMNKIFKPHERLGK
jgi:hypothetical protein